MIFESITINSNSNLYVGPIGRGRGTESQHIFKSIEEEGGGRISESSSQANSKSGAPMPRKDGYGKTTYSRSHNNWEERETSTGGGGVTNNSSTIGAKKEYSRGSMNEENWRNKAAANAAESESSSHDTAKESSGQAATDEASSNPSSNEESSNAKNESTYVARNWRTALDKPAATGQQSASSGREWPAQKKTVNSNSNSNTNSTSSSSSNNNVNNTESSSKTKNSTNQDMQKKSYNPEWLDDDDEENAMTFDDSGKKRF